MEKQCSKCDKEPRTPGKRDGLGIECRRAYQREYQRNRYRAITNGTWQHRKTEYVQHGLSGTAVHTKWAALKRRGSKIDLEQIKAAAELFQGKCEVCSTPLELEQANFDHCHNTDKFRGWLCRNCNSGLGLFKDDPRLLALALKYLTERDPLLPP